jgi:hypothetical protein
MGIRRLHRSRKLVIGLALIVALALGAATAAHASIFEDVWDGAESLFDGDCEENNFDFVPCELDTDGALATNEPDCLIGITASGLEATAPVTATFKVHNQAGTINGVPNPMASATFEFSDGTTGWPITNNTFSRTFQPGEFGQHSVTVTATMTSGATCSRTHEFYVRPKPWMVLYATPIANEPARVKVHAGAMVDAEPQSIFNWDFGIGTPIDCVAWCNQSDVIVEFPTVGEFEITATLASGGVDLSKTIVVHIDGSAPQANIITPEVPVTADGGDATHTAVPVPEATSTPAPTEELPAPSPAPVSPRPGNPHRPVPPPVVTIPPIVVTPPPPAITFPTIPMPWP